MAFDAGQVTYQVWQHQAGDFNVWVKAAECVADSTAPGDALAYLTSELDPDNEFSLWPGCVITHVDPDTGHLVVDVEPS